MTTRTLSLFAALSISCAAFAQTQSTLLTFSDPEQSLSGSGGTVLASLLPNEMHFLDYGGPCPLVSAEKWLPRSASNVMAGDDNANGVLFKGNVFGQIDALLSVTDWVNPVPFDTQRSVYFSPSVPLGTSVSGAPGLRPGDVGRIARVGGLDGQIEYFVTQEQINQALGLPPAYPIDVDAVAFQPNFGLFFSIDADVTANTGCGPMLVQDGDVLCIPPIALSLGAGFTVSAVLPASAVVVYPEAVMDAFVASAQVSDRFGVCLAAVGDVEALDIDLAGPVDTIVPCVGFTLNVPNLVFSCENGTGGSVLETAGGGAIRSSVCGPMGTSCGFGPTLGFQVGIQPFSGNIGAPSHVNALASTRVCRHVTEPQQHVMNVFPLGAPFGANMVDYHNPLAIGWSLITFPVMPVPVSLPAGVFSPTCFPDYYPLPNFWQPTTNGYGSIPTPAIPPAWSGKILIQNLGVGPGFELSTPSVIDVQ